jgi:hypothetical protein
MKATVTVLRNLLTNRILDHQTCYNFIRQRILRVRQAHELRSSYLFSLFVQFTRRLPGNLRLILPYMQMKTVGM